MPSPPNPWLSRNERSLRTSKRTTGRTRPTRRGSRTGRGTVYNPFSTSVLTEAKISQVYNGVLGTVVRDRNKGKESIAVWEGSDARTRAMVLPRGLDPILEEAIEIYRRWDDLDAAHAAALARLAAASMNESGVSWPQPSGAPPRRPARLPRPDLPTKG
jgi:hypothetical protein